MRFRKIYLEISNICNLNCRFCPKTKRKGRIMTKEDFSSLLPKLRPYSDYLYFHLMGEPLCHPLLADLLDLAGKEGFKVIITTNGTLLAEKKEILLSSPALHKINISLHAFEANDIKVSFDKYLDDCFDFGRSSNGKKIVVYRLWNKGGDDSFNGDILEKMKKYFPFSWVEERHGTRISDRTYLEHGDKFDWPDLGAPEGDGRLFCYGLRDQIGVLCDGTVVPCCLDHEGDISLGNLFDSDLSDILSTPRAKAIYDGFTQGEATEELCRRCGYARRFK